MIKLKCIEYNDYKHHMINFNENEIKSTYQTSIKRAFRAYFFEVEYKSLRIIDMRVFFMTDKCIYRNSTRIDNDGNIEIDDIVKALLDEATGSLFTDDEICSPCKTMAEYRKREHYLYDYYINQIDHASYYNPDSNSNERYSIYDPVSREYTSLNNIDFVKHHVWLAMQLKKNMKPTIFLDHISDLGRLGKAATYLSCIPYAEPDDPMMDEAVGYLNKYGGQIAKEAYDLKMDYITHQLVLGRYVKVPTLRKLLEMANEHDDAKLAAIILEQLKDKKASSSRFSL